MYFYNADLNRISNLFPLSSQQCHIHLKLPPRALAHSSHARGRKITWADWFMIPRTTDRLVKACEHKRDPV